MAAKKLPSDIEQLFKRLPSEENEEFDPIQSTLSLDERFELCSSVGVEIVQPDELRSLLEKKQHPVCYDGFEPSGRMHIAQAVVKSILVNKLSKAGCVFIFYIADYFAMLNHKMGGDLKKIQEVGRYFIEVWKACGMDMRNVKFVWASDSIAANSMEYWQRVLDISTKFNVARIKRCSQIMGRSEGDDQQVSQMLYPVMQCGDIFHLQADICQLGLDQRKVNMLAREYCDVTGKQEKPVVISHGMLPGLLEGQEKMSKSDPDSAIFVDDPQAAIIRKIKRAFCPPKQVADNPCVAYVEAIVLPKLGVFTVKRSEKNGGNIVYSDVEDFKRDYADGSLHPADLKAGLSAAIIEILEPIRLHFENDPKAKKLLETILTYKTATKDSK